MLTETKHRMDNDQEINKKMTKLLSEEGLKYPSDLKIWHVVDLLHDVIKVETLKSKVIKSLEGFRFAVHPGCQIIRPSEIGRVDDSENPKKLDELVKALGAETLAYSEKLDCCGASLMYSHKDAALSLAGSKLKALQGYEIDGVIDTCPYCHEMYDAKQDEATTTVGGKLSVSVLYYTQILGIALGIDHKKLGLNLNQSKDLKQL
jgi:heterodisulfide reductase subunit B